MPGILPDHFYAPSLRSSSATGFGSAPDPNDVESASILLLLHGAASAEAFRHKLAMLTIEAERRLALHPSRRNADQPAAAAGSAKTETKSETKTESKSPATSEVTPDRNPASAADNPPAGKDAPPSPSK
jgi:hypothetical protein